MHYSHGETSLSRSPFPWAGISPRKPFSSLQPCHRQLDLGWCVACLYHAESVKRAGCREAPRGAVAPAVAGEGAVTTKFKAANSDFQHF